MTALATALRQFSIRSMRHSVRDAEALLMAIVLPTMIMLVFTVIFGGAIDTGTGDYVDYIVPGVIFLCAGFGASSVAVYVATDMQNGIIDRFRVMPVPAYGVIVGHVGASVVRNTVATSLVIGIGVLLGFRPDADLQQWGVAAGVILGFIIALTWLFAAIGLTSGSPAAASGYGFVLLFLPYLSSAFVPTETMPDWIQPVADNQPMTPMMESVRSLLSGQPAGNDLWIALAWIVGLIAVAVSWSLWAFRRRSPRR